MAKPDWQRKTYPLKLNLSASEKDKIDNMIFESKKVINGAISVITNNILPRFTKLNKEVNGKCFLCYNPKKPKLRVLRYKFKDFDGTEKNVCGCYYSHYSLRKLVLPSKNYSVRPENNIKQFGKFNLKNVYDSCLQKAVETIKSQIEINKKIDSRIRFFQNRSDDISKFLLGTLKDKELNNKFKNYSKTKLKSFIKKNEKKIKREENKKAKKIEYKKDTVRLYENTYELYKDGNDFKIKLNDYCNKSELDIKFFGDNYQKKMAEEFIKTPNAETEIIRKNEDYYLQYIYRKADNVPVPDKTFNPVGIDVGILNMCCLVALKKKEIDKVRFWNGREIRRRRIQFAKIRRIHKRRADLKRADKKISNKWYEKWLSERGQSFSLFNGVNKEKKYMKYVLHKISTDVVQYVKDNVKKPVIVLEDLKNIRDENLKMKKIGENKLKKIFSGKPQSRKFYLAKRRLNRELNAWNFDMFQKFIEYKARWYGMPVVFLPATNTSIKCNKCGCIDENNYYDLHQLIFKCVKCDYQVNIDFNAGVNLANGFYDYIKEKK